MLNSKPPTRNILLSTLIALAISSTSVQAEDDTGVPAKFNFQVKPDTNIQKLLPTETIQKGYFIAGTNPNTPPTTFLLDDNKTLSGRDVDLMNAIGQRLGLKVIWKDSGGFNNVIPGLKTGRFDMVLSNIRPSKTRFAQIDFLSYFDSSRQAVISRKDSDIAPFKSLNALCGQTVGAGVGTAQIGLLNDASKICVSEGKSAIAVAVFPSRPDGIVAVLSNRIPFYYGPWEGLAWQADKIKNLAITGEINVNEPPMSIGFPKGSPNEKAVQAALNSLIQDGTYQKILDHWLIGYGAVKEARLNEDVFSTHTG
ncbi:ABC transporter substrate-binding protein [Pantoea sp. A4]|uniref:ABC transporter substrate-binding protein n=1 Tax=Pantoea sp. A4 TaxID=1225184 RepID=UPI00036B9DBA|nr:ABC transporter substrate-binding protein [Pantoea sp. A4]